MTNIDFEHRNFSIKEAAEHLRISESYIWKLIREKKLRALKIGGRTIITGAELFRLQESSAA